MSSNSWRDEALCRGADIDLFFTVRGQSTQPAKRICFDCPVAQECLDYALEHNITDGVWGGWGGRELRLGVTKPNTRLAPNPPGRLEQIRAASSGEIDPDDYSLAAPA